MFPNDAAGRTLVRRNPLARRRPLSQVRLGERPGAPDAQAATLPLPDCRKDFSVKTDTLMHNSKLGFQVWGIAIYLLATNLKSASSMKLHRDLSITQKSAWHLAHRIRETWQDEAGPFAGPVEVDETFMGGKRRNMPKAKRAKLEGRGAVGKTAVAGAKDRATNRVSAKVTPATDAPALQGFVRERTARGATVYTDDAAAYASLPDMFNGYRHDTVRHSVGEYVRGMAHERHRIVLVDAQAGAQRDVPQDRREAP